ncbi:ssDNA-binding protein [Gordonia phage Pupper]|uniref:SsDNA-binding protein n=1 Tax=Gordonia phage Pupper TaxID=2571249 RepID=A0A4Y6EKR8_9CAUD|nr:single strand DNA binding protein [Gordonia phage Pupper]QDF18637.1 ssDNA-binding protein [Gordonia phage Pupper]
MAKTGLDALKSAIKSAASAGGAFGGKLAYANWKDGETHVIRFLTDVEDILTCDFYEYIVDKDNKTQNFTVLPDVVEGAEDWVIKLGGKTREKGMTGDLVDPRPKQRTVAIAVLREEDPQVINGRTVIKYRDVIEEIEVKGEKYPARKFLLVKQSHKNFWQPMVGFYDEYGTLCDRDYKITRQGAKTDTTYQIVPKDPDGSDFDIKKHYEGYGYGRPYDEEDPDRYLFCPQTLPQWAESYGSEERVRYFLLGEREASGDSKPSGGSATKAAASNDDGPPWKTDENDKAPVSEETGSEFSSLRERLKAHSS